MKDYQVLTIGDAMLDIFLLVSKTAKEVTINRSQETFSALLGAKIPVENAAMELGGNASNTGVGLSRLGIRSALMAEFGDDDFSHHIIEPLQKNHVSMEYCIHTKHAPSTFSVILNFGTDRTIFSRHVPRKHQFSFSDISAEWVYLNSMGRDWETAYLKIFDYVKKQKPKFIFSPGSRQLHDTSEVYKEALPLCDLLFVNREEGELIAYGKEHTQGISLRQEEKLLKDLKALGPKIVSVTDGEKGSYAIDEQGLVHHQKTLPCKVFETTGVGDAYASGFLAARILGKEVPEAMLWGIGNSASVIEQTGAIAGLLTKAELEKRIYV